MGCLCLVDVRRELLRNALGQAFSNLFSELLRRALPRLTSLYNVGFESVDKPYQARVDNWSLLIDTSEVRIMVKELSQRALMQHGNLRGELCRIHATF
ncbi:hypothetical protein AQB9606_03267 [Aquabacterium sp. CECT 9606]|nr:hypothetical protein AQB9606_03267 [Aquabacterium sp. CECT 9606]